MQVSAGTGAQNAAGLVSRLMPKLLHIVAQFAAEFAPEIDPQFAAGIDAQFAVRLLPSSPPRLIPRLVHHGCPDQFRSTQIAAQFCCGDLRPVCGQIAAPIDAEIDASLLSRSLQIPAQFVVPIAADSCQFVAVCRPVCYRD